MTTTRTTAKPATVKLADLRDAFEFANAGAGIFDSAAYVCRETGRFYWVGDDADIADEDAPLPEDLETSERYLALPQKNELGLGKPLALAFARQHLPDDLDQVHECFGRRGAWGRFKALLDRRGVLEDWHRFEEAQTVQALRQWCADQRLTVVD